MENYVQVFDTQYINVLLSNFKNCLENEWNIDVIFLCKDKKKVKAHQLILKMVSKFLSQIFIEFQETSTCRVVYISVPDVSSQTLKRVISFIYTGAMTYNEVDLEDVQVTMKFLGIPHPRPSIQDDVIPLAVPKTNHSLIATFDLTDDKPQVETTKLNINDSKKIVCKYDTSIRKNDWFKPGFFADNMDCTGVEEVSRKNEASITIEGKKTEMLGTCEMNMSTLARYLQDQLLKINRESKNNRKVRIGNNNNRRGNIRVSRTVSRQSTGRPHSLRYRKKK